MAVSSRNKGARGELEFMEAWTSAMPKSRLRRNTRQYQTAGEFDLISDDPSFPFGFEVKRRRTGGFKPEWEKQAKEASDVSGLLPVLAYRFDRNPWWVATPAYVTAVGFGWDLKEYADFTGWMHMRAEDFFPIALEIWVNDATANSSICPQCDGSGITIEEIVDPVGFAESLEVEVACWFCQKGVQ